jgi:predicted DNA-binding transcriptional regulator AlpA
MLTSNLIGSVEIAAIIKKSRITVYRWAEIGKLPKPIYTSNSLLWDRAEVFSRLEQMGYDVSTRDEVGA